MQDTRFWPRQRRCTDGHTCRPRQGKIIAGVCAGLARRFGISVTLIRVAFVVFAVTGVGELVYLILWVVMPKAPE